MSFSPFRFSQRHLLENISLTLTTESNVGVIITIAPFFTALLSALLLKSDKPKLQFYVGFLAAIAGVILISCNGSSLQINPLGDFLAVLAAVAWAVYSILTRKISELGYPVIQTTRRIFFYGLLFMLPLLFIMDFSLQPDRFTNLINLGNILYLGLGASALCFVTWNTAVGILGAVKTGVYIYLVPVVTVATSALILNEALTPILILGAILTLAGLWLSETNLIEGVMARWKNNISNV
ncbi:MAG: DMT family transporter [Lachnospiraceae bacterium]